MIIIIINTYDFHCTSIKLIMADENGLFLQNNHDG